MAHTVTPVGKSYIHSGADIPSWAWPPTEQVRGDLQAALAVLREKGWCQGSMRHPDGSVCAIGALTEHISRLSPAVTWAFDPTLTARYFSARALLDLKVKELTSEAIHSTEGFNDMASTRREDIEALYEKVIADL